MAGRPGKRQAGATGDTYHHGDLRRALLDTAVELARTGGPEAVVMRDVQRRVGVSNAAAYRHYSDRDALLAAVIAHALRRLAATMKESLAATSARGSRNTRALARFRATGQAYIDFALAEPGLYRTAFAPHPSGRQPLEGSAGVEDVAEQDHPFHILRGCVDDLVATGVVPARRREGVDEAAWAAVHGLATLFLDGPLSTLTPDEKKRISDRLLDTIQRGVGSS